MRNGWRWENELLMAWRVSATAAVCCVRCRVSRFRVAMFRRCDPGAVKDAATDGYRNPGKISVD
jgi:hypothetical protein